MIESLTLLVPEKIDVESDLLMMAWTRNGGIVKKLGRYWVKDDELAQQQLVVYGSQTFALILAQIYNLELVSPDDSLIARLPQQWTKRRIQLSQIDKLTESDLPIFVKPVVPKSFTSGVFKQYSDWLSAVDGLPKQELILVSEVVTDIEAEARSFICNGVVADLALYEGSADVVKGREFLTDFIISYGHELPSVVVIDLAFSSQRGWFVLEFNACWGAGLNGCLAERVLECVARATRQK